MTTFDLEITFTGLCLYVRDGAKLHVLMPSAEVCHIDKHEARVYVNQRWDRWEELGRFALDLTNLGVGSSATLDVPDKLFNFATLGSQYFVPRELVEGDHAALYSRVTLMNGQAGPAGDGALWAMTDDADECNAMVPVEMSHQLVWNISEVPGDHLRWVFRQFGSSTPGDNSYPRPTTAGKLELHITHAPERNHPNGGGATRVPDNCDSPTHFEAYFALLASSTPKPLPHFRDLGNLPIPTETIGGHLVVPGPKGMVFTCMSAQAPIAP